MPRRTKFINIVSITAVALIVLGDLWVGPLPIVIDDDSDSSVAQLAASASAARLTKNAENTLYNVSIALLALPAHNLRLQFLFEAKGVEKRFPDFTLVRKSCIRAPPESICSFLLNSSFT